MCFRFYRSVPRVAVKRCSQKGLQSCTILGMGIHEIQSTEVEEWSRRVAEHMFELRSASGALPITSANGFLHSIISRFRVGVPIGSRIFVDDGAFNWLWLSVEGDEYSVVDVQIDEINDEWLNAYYEVVGDNEVSFECFYAPNPLIATLPHRDYSIDMVADISRVHTGGIDAQVNLRPMSSGEVMSFMLASANETGKALSLVTPHKDLNTLKRDAFRHLESRLIDGVATPGQMLYTIEVNYEAVGSAWMEIDSGTCRINSVILKPGNEGRGYRRAAVVALAEIARLEGMRRLVATIIPPSNTMAEVLEKTGFIPVRRLSYILARSASEEGSADDEAQAEAVVACA